ncbi:MAG: PilZ domain-containing protein [Deferrisomatales bacterium]
MDRRARRRRRTRLRINVDPGGVSSFTGDLSPGGVFVYAARVHRPGTAVRLVLRLPAGAAGAEGVVRWAKRVPAPLLNHIRGGMGIEFTWVSPELEAFLGGESGLSRAAG